MKDSAKNFTVSEMRIGFFSNLIGCLVIFVFSVLMIIVGRSAEYDVSVLGFIGVLVSVCLFLYGIITFKFRSRNFYRYIQSYAFCLDAVTRASVETFVNPIVVIKDDGEIIWSNEHFLSMIGRSSHYGEYIQDLFNNLSIDKYVESSENVVDDFEYGGRSYIINGRAVKSEYMQDTLVGLYFVDVTEINKIKQEFEDKQCVQCLVVIDNYDEVIKETPNSNHGALMGEIERCVNAWVAMGSGVSRRYEREKFLVMFHNKEYNDIIEKEKYKVLNEVRNINLENKIPVTLSIGTGRGGATLEENNRMANLALEMALGRGGDQVVVKSPDSYKFFGAKSREVEKSTKVKARVMAHALREAIDQASNIIIMGHKNSDMDCLGAAIGLYQAIRSRNADAYIAIKKNATNASLLLNNFVDEPKYANNIISGERALSLMDRQSLVIVVDTHRRSMVEFAEVLDNSKSIVLIDHHRRAEDFISNAILTYHEPYASSTCEMVTEILQYIQDNPKIGIKEAEALYAGIFLDTKGFTFKTGVRTFEAAAYLRRMGVDPVHVRRLFKSDLKDCIRLSKVISSAKVYRDNIAVVVCEDTGKDLQVLVAKAADELLNVAGIEASFVIAKLGHKIIISGRSLETVNVQLILERLGGGGHITIAGAQLSNQDIDIALGQLYKAIDDVLDERE
ncbi:MAG TPA: DHH family phosphoesterase [Candidatus Monoglobus merdigallinarum]|uniref:Cyclic-di-AMP phosphodiesterase n=1 Tax=Candidatus Monoglobus merdigallinarum TaxID=2838698 RepID=A0A9D1PQ81_9FIRM|nr:DHH family phosphoesterase [Candidatus Monoglobus merdigallinarum]